MTLFCLKLFFANYESLDELKIFINKKKHSNRVNEMAFFTIAALAKIVFNITVMSVSQSFM